MSKRKTKHIYLDHAGSAPLDPQVFSVMKKVLGGPGANPSALHKEGTAAKNLINEAREKVARILGAQKEEIIFTSGGTESNNLAILGVIASACENYYSCALPGLPGGSLGVNNFDKLPHLVTTNIEHPSVLEVCRYLEKTKQAEVTCVPVEANGIVDSKKIKEAIKPNTVLVSVMYANNEIGTIQPIMEIAKEIRHYRKSRSQQLEASRYPYFHTDAAQAMNYLPVRVEKLGVDLMSFNGSKIYGPKGTGVLFKKRNVKLVPIMHGGDQEYGLNPGTENVAGIVGLATALEISEKIKEKESIRLTKLRDYFIKKLTSPNPLLNKERAKGEVILNGDPANRLPNNVNISISGIESDLLVIELDAKGIAVSSKSACKSDDPEESYVISALRGRSSGGSEVRPLDDGSVRFSLGRSTTKAEIDLTLKALGDILAKLKKWYN